MTLCASQMYFCFWYTWMFTKTLLSRNNCLKKIIEKLKLSNWSLRFILQSQLLYHGIESDTLKQFYMLIVMIIMSIKLSLHSISLFFLDLSVIQIYTLIFEYKKSSKKHKIKKYLSSKSLSKTSNVIHNW